MPRGKKELAEQFIPYAARGRSRGGEARPLPRSPAFCGAGPDQSNKK